MPSIPKGATISDADKAKIAKLKKKGASKSELSTVRMALLRGHTYRKAMNLMKKKAMPAPAAAADKKSRKRASKREEQSVEVVVEEPMETLA
jgi:hypothetical protein